MQSRRPVLRLGALFLPILIAMFDGAAAAQPRRGTEARDVVGVAHAAGRYSFTQEDFLNEGADVLLALGTRVIKVWFVLDPAVPYPWNPDGLPPAESFVELARRPIYRELFAKPFTTYFLVIPPVTGNSQFLDGMTAAERAEERDAFEALARYLLRTYAGTGKTFVLQNWEGDHLLRQWLPEGAAPNRMRLRGMRDWWNSRQEGVDRARRAVRVRGVTVAHAIEVNLLAQAMEGRVTAVNQIVPKTHADLYSYSSWDLGFDRRRLTQALDYLAAKAPDSALYGARNLVLGEVGAVPDQIGHSGLDAEPRELVRGLVEAALGWGVRWAVYWQVYCNEAAQSYTGRPRNEDLRGFWLVRPDGTRVPLWDDLALRLAGGSLLQAILATTSGHVAAGGGAAPRADRWWADPWARWTFTDLDGEWLDHGDAVTLQSHDGLFLTAEEDGAVSLQEVDPGPAATFRVWRSSGRGHVQNGDAVVLQAHDGRFVGTELGTGALRSDRPGAGGSETFRLWMPDERPRRRSAPAPAGDPLVAPHAGAVPAPPQDTAPLP